MLAARIRFIELENGLHRQLVTYSIPALRLSVGLIFLLFGFLKFFPGVSPAQDLVERITDLLTFGLVPGSVALVAVATLECFIGLCFLAGRWMRLAIWLLALQFVGILSPLVLLSGELFGGPGNAPTLAGQYVIKDIVLVAAGMVIAAGAFRGGRLVRDEPQPMVSPQAEPDAQARLEIVLSGLRGRPVEEICAERGICEATYYTWRDVLLDGASEALRTDPRSNGPA